MNATFRRAGLLAVFLLAALGAGCKQEGDKIVVNTENPNATALEIQYGNYSMLVPGYRLQLTANAVVGEAVQNWTHRATWSVNDTLWATVDSAGMLFIKQPGTGQVTASAGDLTDVQSITAYTIVSLMLEGDTAPLLRGERADFTLRAILAESSYLYTVPAAVAVEWLISAPEVATVNAAGDVEAVASGYTTVAARVAGITSPPLVVAVDSVLSLRCDMLNTAFCLPLDTVTCAATATTLLAGDLDLTNRVMWQVSDTRNLLVLGNGAFLPTVAGSFSVTAGVDGRTGSTDMQILALTDFAMDPDAVTDTLSFGDTLVFHATANISTLGETDVTDRVQWTVSNPATGEFVAPGVFVAAVGGTTELSARHGAAVTPRVTVNVRGGVRMREDFETYAYGAFSGGSRWDVVATSPARAQISNVASHGTHSCRLADSLGYHVEMTSVGRVFGQLERGSVSLDMRTNLSGLSLELGSGPYTTACMISFDYSYITAYDGSTEVTLVPWTASQWYHIDIQFDCAAHSFDVYVNGVLAGEDLQIYSSSIGFVDRLNFDSGYGSGYYTQRFIDNIVVSE